MYKHLGIKEIFSLVFACILMPAFIVFFALNFWTQTSLELQKNTLLRQTESATSRLQFHIDNVRFWTHLFNQTSLEGVSGDEFKRKLDYFSQKFKQKFAYVIWPEKQKMILNFTSENKLVSAWQKALPIVLKGMNDPGGSTDPFNDQFMRKLIGPHFYIRRINESRTMQNSIFVESDFRMKYPLVWANTTDKMTALVMMPPAVIKKKQGIQKFCQELLKDKNLVFTSFAIVKNEQIFGNANFSFKQLNKFKQRMNAAGQKIIRHSDYLIAGDEFDDGSFFIAISHYEKIPAGKATALFVLLQLFFALTMIRTSDITRIFARLRVAHAIFILIGLSNVLPLVFLLFFSNQYLIQKKIALLENKRAEAIKFIQLLEQKFDNEIAKFPGQAVQAIAPYHAKLQKGMLSLDDAGALYQTLVDKNLHFQLVANSTAMNLSDDGYLLDGRYVDLRIRKRNDERKRTSELFRKIAAAYLCYWNNTPVSEKDLTEIELVVELLFQKPLDEAMHIFVEMNDRIKMFGFGSTRMPSFIHIFSFNRNGKGDLFGMFQKSLTDAGREFLENCRKDRLANQYGFKVIYGLGPEDALTGITPFRDYTTIQKLLQSLKNYPPVSVEIVDIENRRYLSVGYISSIIEGYRLLAFFPVAEIEKILATERDDLFWLFAMNILLVLSLAYFFSEMLLLPVQKLENCTREIVAANYAYRISDLGDDEMGQMGQVLNAALADLEELGVARLVQQQLFPQGQLPVAPFSLFGKSVTLADLGGDYFDYFKVSDEKFAVLLGDVAGHGVGAAMIMAMAKAATLNSDDCYENPVAFLNRLHQIIYSSKTRRQKKVMTMQYLCVNQNKKTLIYANAGGCNPFIINNQTGRIQEIDLSAPVLGAFKKSAFKEIEIAFDPGDVMVLYTDGIAEARNVSGEEIGFNGLKYMLQRNYNPDPEKFYQAVYLEYCTWLGKAPPQDDLTMIFLALNAD